MSVNSKMTAIANAIRAKRGISGVLTLDQMATEIGNIQGGITPTGTKSITANGAYDVTQFASAEVAVRNGTHNRHYEVTNPASVSGTGNYFTAISRDAALAQVRSFTSLVVMYRTEGTAACVKSGIGLNEIQKYPIHSQTGADYQAVGRFDSSGNFSFQNSLYPLSSAESITSGSGRIYITENGDLRIYGNTSGYAIPAGKITIDVLWDET